MRYLVTILLASISLARPDLALADTCDISQFKNFMSYKQDIMTTLSYINRVASTEDRSKNDNADINVLDYGSFTYGQASSFSSSLETLLDIKWTQRDQEWLLVSNLSDEGVKAYVACLQKENNANLVVNLSPAASDSDEFFVNYAWRPSYAAPNPAQTHIILSNAVSKDAPSKIKTPSADVFKVKRTSMYKALELGIHVDGQPYPTISLPAFPAKKLERQLRSNSETHEVYGGGNSTIKRICVTLDNSEQDAVIVPNSVNATVESDISERAQLIKGAITYNPRQACSVFVWHLEATDGHVRGKATIEVTVSKAVPVANVNNVNAVKAISETSMFKGQ
jgi:hypothetical protein